MKALVNMGLIQEQENKTELEQVHLKLVRVALTFQIIQRFLTVEKVVLLKRVLSQHCTAKKELDKFKIVGFTLTIQ